MKLPGERQWALTLSSPALAGMPAPTGPHLAQAATPGLGREPGFSSDLGRPQPPVAGFRCSGGGGRGSSSPVSRVSPFSCPADSAERGLPGRAFRSTAAGASSSSSRSPIATISDGVSLTMRKPWPSPPALAPTSSARSAFTRTTFRRKTSSWLAWRRSSARSRHSPNVRPGRSTRYGSRWLTWPLSPRHWPAICGLGRAESPPAALRGVGACPWTPCPCARRRSGVRSLHEKRPPATC